MELPQACRLDSNPRRASSASWLVLLAMPKEKVATCAEEEGDYIDKGI